MKLTLLGTGTPTPSLQRTSSSYLLEIDDDVILFDAGPGAYIRLLQAGKQPTDLTHVVFSHFHYDHCADFATIALTRWDHNKDKPQPLKIYGPSHINRFIESLFGVDGAFKPDIDSRIQHETSVAYYKARGGEGQRPYISFDINELKSGDVIDEKNWQLQCVNVPHFQPFLSCLGYRLESKGKSFCYSGDSSKSSQFPKLAQDCDVMVHMCHRISGTELTASALKSSSGHLEAAHVAENANAKSCVFTHISDQMDVPGVPEDLISQISQIYKGNTIWGQDLMEIDFTPPKPKALI